jgi:hypothetical protein
MFCLKKKKTIIIIIKLIIIIVNNMVVNRSLLNQNTQVPNRIKIKWYLLVVAHFIFILLFFNSFKKFLPFSVLKTVTLLFK